MFSKFDLIVFEAFKKFFYALPGASIYGYPIGQMVSLTVILYAFGEAVLYSMPHTSGRRLRNDP